jgi:GAF domain-containing protein
MAKTSKAKDKEKAAQADIQKRVEGLFIGEEFPASASISQVEALKARVLELEARLQKQQSAEARPEPVLTGSLVSEIGPSIAVDTNPKQSLPEPEERKRSFFRNLLRAPKFGNMAKDRIANLQQNILMSLFFFTLLGIVISVATWGDKSINGFSILTFEFILSLLALFLQRRGYLDQASWVLVSALYLVFLMGFYLTGYSFEIAVLLALTISLAGLLFRNRSVIVFTAFTIVTLWVCSYIFVLPVPIKLNELIYASLLLGLEGLLLSLASFTLEKSFFEVDRSTQTLMSTNQNLQNMTLNLEKRVGERTHDLELVIDVSQAVSGKSANLSSLLREAVELIRERFDLYYTQIYLVDTSGRLLILQAGTGNAGVELLRRDHRLSIASGSLNGRAAAEKQAIVVVDTHQNANFLPNPLLPNTRSEMAVPLILGEKVVGVLDMQSEYPGALNEANLPAFEALAGQLAVAIQNAGLFAEIEAARLNVESQVRRTSERGWLDFLNSTDRGQKLGFAFDQNQVIQLKKEDLKPLPARSALNVPIQVTGARVGMIQVANEPDRVWTNAENGILKATAEQLAQHIENLRLLDQADKYRLEAEDAVRRLTREGWGTYLQMHKTETVGFAFDLNEVYSLSEKGTDTQSLATVHPLTIRDEIVGEFSVNSSSGSQDDVSELISAVASQLSEHIENLRLTEQTQSALNETETLYQASAELNSATTYDQILDVIRRYTLLGNNTHIVSLNYFDRPWVGDAEPDWIDVLARWTTLTTRSAPSRFNLSNLPSANQILFPDVPTLVEDVLTDPRMDASIRALYTGQFGARSTIFIPLVIGGQWLGYINGMYQQSTLFPESDIRQLMTLAGQAAVAINNLRSLILTQERVKREQALRQITAEMRASTDPATIMRTAVRELGNMLGRKTVVQLLNTEQANLAGPAVIDANKSDSLVRKS